MLERKNYKDNFGGKMKNNERGSSKKIDFRKGFL
jgi:hypothetical protein